MTYRDLLNRLQGLTADQLDQEAHTMGFERCGRPITGCFIAAEDYVNPSGDGDEPVAAYRDDSDFNIDEEPISIKAGTVLMIEGEGSRV